MSFSFLMRNLSRCICFICVSLVFTSSYGAEHYQDVLPTKTLTIVRGIGNYPPLEMVENGRLTGLHIEMVRHVATQLGFELEFMSLPWVRAIKYFSSGKVDAISYFGYTEEREKFSYFHEDNVLSNTRWVFLALEERQHEFSFDRNLVGLENLLIGVQNGYSHGKYFDSMEHLKRDVVLNEFDIEMMLKNKRHDLSMMSYQEFLGFKERGDFKGIVALSPYIDTDPQYLAFSRIKKDEGRQKKLSELFAKEFKRFKASDAYHDLLIKYDFFKEK